MLAPSLTYRPTKDTSITVLGNFRNDDSGSALQFLPAAGTLYPNKQGRIVPRDSFQGEPGDYYNTDAESVSLFVDQRLAPGLDLHHVSRYSHTDNTYDFASANCPDAATLRPGRGPHTARYPR